MTLKKTSAQMVAEARARVEEVETAAAIEMVGDENVQFVDLRDPRERERTGFIPGSFHCPRGMLEFWVDPDSPYFKDVFAQEKKVRLSLRFWLAVCDIGGDTQDMGFEAAHLKEGFSTWEKAGGPVER